MGRSVDLLIPGLGWNTGLLRLGVSPSRPRHLEGLLSRARPRAIPVKDLSEILFQGFGVESSPNRDLPCGAVVSFALGRNPGDGVCALATPVHLLTDRDRLLLLRHEPRSLPDTQVRSLAEQFNTHFATTGMHVEVLSNTQWVLMIDDLSNVTTSMLECVAGRHIDPYLPRGPDALSWHQFLNEIQMLFFQSEVNQQRSVAGLLPVNGLWVSGVGCLPEVQTSYRKVFAESTLASGLAKLAGIPCEPSFCFNADEPLSEGAYLVVMSELMEAEIDVHEDAWISGLERIEQRLRKLTRTLDQPDDRISLHTCDGRCFEVRTQIRLLDRFRRRKTLDQLFGKPVQRSEF
jgi:hypothetical protein